MLKHLLFLLVTVEGYNQSQKDFNDRYINKRGAQCSLAVFGMENAQYGLPYVVPLIQNLTKIFPLKSYDFRTFTAISGKPTTEPDFSQWLAALKTTIVAVDAQVANWRKRHFNYIGLPLQSTFLAPYLTGIVTAANGSNFTVARGNINQRFDAQQQYILENPGTPVVDLFGTHIVRLYDSQTPATLLGANLAFFGVLDSPTGPVNLKTKLFLIVQNGDAISSNIQAQVQSYFDANGLTLHSGDIYLIDQTGTEQDPAFFSVAQSKAVGQKIQQASTDPSVDKIVVAIVVGAFSDEATRDFLNAGIFCNCPSGKCSNAAGSCTPYPKVAIWGLNWGPGGDFTVPVPSSIGLSPVEFRPSIEWTAIGYPKDPVAFSAQTNDPYLLEQVKWASQCRTIEKTRVAPASYTLSGNQYKFIKSTKITQWLQPVNYAANAAEPTDVDKNFQVNPLWANAAP